MLTVLCITGWNALRVWTALAWSNVLNEFSSRPPVMVTAVSGAVWTLTGLLLIWGIWRRKSWAAGLLLGAAAGCSVWYWSERLLWQSPHPNWKFAVIVNLVLLGFISSLIKSLTREAHEQENENPKPERS